MQKSKRDNYKRKKDWGGQRKFLGLTCLVLGKTQWGRKRQGKRKQGEEKGVNGLTGEAFY